MDKKADLITIRHAKTNYTNEGLDITEEGIEATKKLAQDLKDYLAQFEQIIIITSPTARTKGTAKVFLEELSQDLDPRTFDSIRCVDIYDMQKFDEFNNAAPVNDKTKVYGEDWFSDNVKVLEGISEDNKKFMEGRRNVDKRAFRFLYHIGHFILRAAKEKNTCVIAFTHFEIGTNYLKPLYSESSQFPSESAAGLLNSEAVVLSFDPANADIIEIKARDRSVKVKLENNNLILLPKDNEI